MFNFYPYTDFHEMNLDMIIEMIKKLTGEVHDFKVVNKITFFGDWDITKQYPAWSIVNVGLADGYISIKPVPVGVNYTDTNYWVHVANYSALYADMQNRIIALENTVGDASSGLVKDVDDLQSDVASLQGDVSGLLGAENLSGKKILIIGDSISDENLYPNCWVKDFRTKVEGIGGTVTNHSLQGRTIGKYTGATNTLVNALNTVPAGTYDYIIVFLGINDWVNVVDLGYINDNNVDSVCYNIGAFQSWHRSNQPQARVTFITPLKCNIVNVRHRLTQFYARAIISCATFYGFQIIDAQSFAPLLNNEHIDDWTIDGLHPTDSYAPYLADFIFGNVASGVSSVGANLWHTSEIITDVNSNNNTVECDYTGDGRISYRVKNFSVSTNGLIKIADLPEENQSRDTLYGQGFITVTGTSYPVTMLSTGSALYLYKPTTVPNGDFAGCTAVGFVKYGVNIANASI